MYHLYNYNVISHYTLKNLEFLNIIRNPLKKLIHPIQHFSNLHWIQTS